MIVAVKVPKPLPSLVHFHKVSKRRMDDISTIAAGFSLDLDAAGRVIGRINVMPLGGRYLATC